MTDMEAYALGVVAGMVVMFMLFPTVKVWLEGDSNDDGKDSL